MTVIIVHRFKNGIKELFNVYQSTESMLEHFSTLGIVKCKHFSVYNDSEYSYTKKEHCVINSNCIEYQNESELPEQVLQVNFVDGKIRFFRFPGNYTSKDFKNYLEQNEHVKEIKCTKNNITYKR